MKIRIIVIIAFILAGIVVTFSLTGSEQDREAEYQNYLQLARANAEKEIPYMAVQNYQKVLQMDASDESVYNEYLVQAKALGGDYYNNAVKQYTYYFPDSSAAYEMLCQYYYEQELYQFVMKTALEAREKGIATDTVKKLYLECSVMFKVISTGFEEAGSFVGEYAKVKLNDLYGFINNYGNYAILPKYEDASFYFLDHAAVCEEDEWYIMNDSGFKIAATGEKVDYLGILNNGWIPFGLNGKYDYIASNMVIPDELRFDDVTNFKNGVAAVKQKDKWALINSEMGMITEFVFDDVVRDEFNTCINNGVIIAQKGGKYYMVNATGARITEETFDEVRPFVGTDPAAFRKGEKWGFIDNTGNVVIEPQYDDAKSFNIGLAPVCIDGLWGYIDTSNAMRIECQFVDCLPFSSNGVTAYCDEENTWTYIKLLSYVN